jgi:hypothetical protein
MGLVINQLTFDCGARDGSELPTADSKASGWQQTSEQDSSTASQDDHSCVNHDLVNKARISHKLEVSTLFDFEESLHHVLSRNADLVEGKVPIINVTIT